MSTLPANLGWQIPLVYLFPLNKINRLIEFVQNSIAKKNLSEFHGDLFSKSESVFGTFFCVPLNQRLRGNFKF